MKFEIHYTIGEYDDYYILEGENLEYLISKNKIEMAKRCLDENKNNCYSVKIEE